MTITLEALMERGYFPQELPPPFTTASLAKYLGAMASISSLYVLPKQRRTSKPEIFNLARTGTLRRQLSILNPIHFSLLASGICENWKTLQMIASESEISLTTPTLTDPIRAIGRKYSLDILPKKRAETRSKGRFLLRADVIRFYYSIYTHSVPWALHGKSIAKANKSSSLLGNKIDELIRNCQDGQTNGIPVGPDTSLLIAEMILAKVDKGLGRRLNGIRYIDDYELIFNSEAEAIRALSKLQESLFNYELNLNPSKTIILPLPQHLDDSWVAELKNIDLDPSSRRFQSQLVRFFDRAFELERLFPSENILKYAAGRLAKMRIWRHDHDLAEDLLIQCARVEAGALPSVLTSILRSSNRSRARTSVRKQMLHQVIMEHAPQRHSSEVAWSLWACIVLNISLPPRVVRPVLDMEDSICALLLLHARSAGLVKTGRDLDVLKQSLTVDELYDTRWLLAYEANFKGWLASSKGDNVNADANFGKLKAAGVSFYDISRGLLAPSSEDDEQDDIGLEFLGIDYADRTEGNETSEAEDETDDEEDEGETAEEKEKKAVN